MKQKFPFVAIGLILVGLLTATIYGFRSALIPPSQPISEKVSQVVPETIPVSQKIDYAGKLVSVSAELTAQKEETALQLLQRTRSIETKHYDFGDLVQKIDGIEDAKGGFYWIYYINGEAAKVGASEYKLQPNDVIEWRLQKESGL